MISQPSAAASESLTLRLGETAASATCWRSDLAARFVVRFRMGSVASATAASPASRRTPFAHRQTAWKDDGEITDDGSLESM